MKKKTLHIVGAGLSGLITAHFARKQLRNWRVQLYGPARFGTEGPGLLWNTPENDQLLTSLGVFKAPELAIIGHYDSRDGFILPTPDYRIWYKDLFENRGGSRMSQSRSSFPTYQDFDIHRLYLELRKNLKFVSVPYFVSEVSTKNSRITSLVAGLEEYPIRKRDCVVLTLPLYKAQKLLGLEPTPFQGRWATRLDSLTSLMPTLQAVCGEVDKYIPYHYFYSRGTIFYRASRNKINNGLPRWTVESKSSLGLTSTYCYDVTPGEFYRLPCTNVYQIGRMARGDRSLVQDTVRYVLALLGSLV